MSLFESLNNSSESTLDKGKDYIHTSYKYLKLKSFHILSLSISTFVKVFFIGGLIIFGLLFFAISLAIYVGELYDSFAIGFIVAGFLLLLLAIIVFLLGKKIDTVVIKNLANKFSK